MTGLEFTALKEIIGGITLGPITPEILGPIIAFILTIAITRKTEEIKIGMLPMAALISLIGFKIHLAAWVLFIVISITTQFNFNELSNYITTARGKPVPKTRLSQRILVGTGKAAKTGFSEAKKKGKKAWTKFTEGTRKREEAIEGIMTASTGLIKYERQEKAKKEQSQKIRESAKKQEMARIRRFRGKPKLIRQLMLKKEKKHKPKKYTKKTFGYSPPKQK